MDVKKFSGDLRHLLQWEVIGNIRDERADVKIGNTDRRAYAGAQKKRTATLLVSQSTVKSAPTPGQNALTSKSATLNQGAYAGAQK